MAKKKATHTKSGVVALRKRPYRFNEETGDVERVVVGLPAPPGMSVADKKRAAGPDLEGRLQDARADAIEEGGIHAAAILKACELFEAAKLNGDIHAAGEHAADALLAHQALTMREAGQLVRRGCKAKQHAVDAAESRRKKKSAERRKLVKRFHEIYPTEVGGKEAAYRRVAREFPGVKASRVFRALKHES